MLSQEVYWCEAEVADVTVTAQLEPMAQLFTTLLASFTMSMYHTVGPTSWLVVAVSVTPVFTGTDEAVALIPVRHVPSLAQAPDPVGVLVGVLVGGFGVLVGATGVFVAVATLCVDVAEGGTGVLLGATGVEVAVAATMVGVFVAGTGVLLGVLLAPAVVQLTPTALDRGPPPAMLVLLVLSHAVY